MLTLQSKYSIFSKAPQLFVAQMWLTTADQEKKEAAGFQSGLCHLPLPPHALATVMGCMCSDAAFNIVLGPCELEKSRVCDTERRLERQQDFVLFSAGIS